MQEGTDRLPSHRRRFRMTTTGGGLPMKHGNVAAEMLRSRFTFLLVSTALQGMVISFGAAQTRVSLQPLAQQVRQVETTLAYLGQPLSADDREAINQAVAGAEEAAAVARLDKTLDKYTLAT